MDLTSQPVVEIPSEEHNTQSLVVPQRAPRTPKEKNFVLDLENAILSRKGVKSEPNTADPEEESKNIMTEPSSSVREDEKVVHIKIEMPGLMSELKRKVRERPKTMDLGDLSVLRNIPSKKSPAPPIPKIVEAEVPIAKQQVKEAPVIETKITTPTKQEILTIKEVQSPDVPDTTAIKPLIHSQRLEKKPSAEVFLKSSVIGDDGKSNKATPVVSIQPATNVLLEKITPNKIQFAETSNKEVLGKSVTKTVDVQVSSAEKVDHKVKLEKHQSSTVIESKSIKIVPALKNATRPKKNITVESSYLSNQIKSTQYVESKVELSKVASVPMKSNEVVKDEKTPLKNNSQQSNSPGKVSDVKQISVTTSTMGNDKIASDNLSGNKSIDKQVKQANNANRTNSETNVVSDKLKSIDKTVNTNSKNLIKTDANLDNKSVREVTNEFLDMKVKMILEEKKKHSIVSNSSSITSKSTDRIFGENSKTNVVEIAKPIEPANMMKIEKQTGRKEEVKVKASSNTSAINISENKGKQMQQSKILNDKKVITNLATDFKGSPTSNFKIEKAFSPGKDKQELQINTYETSSNLVPNKVMKAENENVSVAPKTEVSLGDKNVNINKTFAENKISQVAKHVITAQKFHPDTKTESGKHDIENKIASVNIDSTENRVKKRASWISESSKDTKSEETTKDTPTKMYSKLTENTIMTKEANVKHIVTSQRSLPPFEPVTKMESAKKDIVNRSDLIPSESRIKTRASWIQDSLKDIKDKGETNSKLAESTKSTMLTLTKETDAKQNETIITENLPNNGFIKSSSLDSYKFNTDKNLNAAMKTNETSTKSIENLNETTATCIKLFGKSASKESLPIVTVTKSSIARSQLQEKSAASKKNETGSMITSGTANTDSSLAKTYDALVNNFRLRNNIDSNVSKSNSNENSNSTKETKLPNVPKSIDSFKTDATEKLASGNKTLNKTVINPTTSSNSEEGLDPFRANRKNNIFRNLSTESTPSKETTKDAKTTSIENETKDVKITTVNKDTSVNKPSSWRVASNIILSNEAKRDMPNKGLPASASPTVTAMTISTYRSSEIKKDINSTDTHKKTSNLEGAIKSSSDARNKDDPTKASDFASPLRIPNFNLRSSAEVSKETITNVTYKAANLGVITKVSTDVKIKDNPVTVPALSNTARSPQSNVPKSFETKKDKNDDKSSNIDSVTKSSNDVLIRDTSIHDSAFTKANYNDLLKKSVRKISTLSLNKEESINDTKIEAENKSISDNVNSKEDKINTHATRGLPRTSLSAKEPIVENKWKRPDTLALQNDDRRISTDKPSIASIAVATTFLQGNRINKSIFENKNIPAATTTNLRSTPTGSLTSLPESESIAKASTNTITKPLDSPSTPLNQNKVSPASRHESPIFNKMFLPPSTFRSSTNIMNKSTEDISATTRNTNSFRQNRPQTLMGNEHVVIKRTMSAAPTVESAMNVKNEAGTAALLQTWRNKGRTNP